MIKAMRSTPGRQDAHTEIERKHSEAETMDLIEKSLRSCVKECVEGGLLFQLKLYGVRYCWLFVHGSEYRYTCPYVDEETIRISGKGMDMMKYRCRYEG